MGIIRLGCFSSYSVFVSNILVVKELKISLGNLKMEVISLYLSTIHNTIDIKYGTDAISTECAICMTEIDSDEGLILSCKHMFHMECIERWFHEHETCCVCRHNVRDIDHIVYDQQAEKSKLIFIKKLFNLVAFRRDVMTIRDNFTTKGYKHVTLIWEDVELIHFEIDTTTEYIEIDYEILDKDLLELLWP